MTGQMLGVMTAKENPTPQSQQIKRKKITDHGPVCCTFIKMYPMLVAFSGQN